MADLSTHLMLDDVNDAILFSHAAEAYALAGYTDGRWANWDAIVKAYPTGKFLLSISVYADGGAHGAQCLDIENGDATIPQAPAWFKTTQAAGKKARDFRWDPKLYTSIDNAHNLISAMEHAGVKRDEYMLWSAHYTWQPHICGPKSCGAAVQADATQWTDRYNGVSLDASMCFGYFFAGPPTSPLPVPVPIPPHRKPVPKRKSGPKRHVADGTESLDRAVARARLSMTSTIETSSLKLSDRHLRKFTDYLAIGTASKMPKGLVFWTAR